MPDLTHALQGRDLGFLRIVADVWGVELQAPDAREALPTLINSLLDRGLVHEVVEALPGEARAALGALQQEEGRMLYALFSRRYGAIREFGPARRDRERPHLAPASPAEVLWYRALISRAFFDTPSEPQEYAYIPDDLLALLPALPGETPAPLGRPASPVESASVVPASDRILDHACTLLAALRMGREYPNFERTGWVQFGPALVELCKAAGLLDEGDMPQPEPARVFLEAGRGQALAILARAWRDSPRFNDLRLLPGLVFEGEWSNDPLQARQFVLDTLSALPGDTWWSLSGLIAAIKERQPDFQRPAGDYDSWFIRNADGYLRGFVHWDDVDGALLRFIICGPLHWLGITDLASPSPGAGPAAFRLSPWGAGLLNGAAPDGLQEETAQVTILPEGGLRVPALVPRAARYQIARFCRWEEERDAEYHYRITPASLAHARRQGLRSSQLLALLRRHGSAPPTPPLAQAIERWELNGPQASLEPAVILRLASPELLEALRRSPAARYLGDPLGPTTVVVKPGAQERIKKALAGMGYLTDDKGQDLAGV
jgi:hypothetical protein